jgi:hypothetical protein
MSKCMKSEKLVIKLKAGPLTFLHKKKKQELSLYSPGMIVRSRLGLKNLL